MAAPTTGSGMKWVGRAIRRLEDPALVTGRGRFTADLDATLWVRFVRSPVASGRIVGITAPDGARIYRAADLDGVRPIRPMLHKFNYQPIEQPILASGCRAFRRRTDRRRRRLIARGGRRHRRTRWTIEIDGLARRSSTRKRRCNPARRASMTTCPGNVVVEGRFKTADFDATIAQARKVVRVDVRSTAQNATPLEARAAHAAFDPASGRMTLTCTTQMPHLTRTAIADVLGNSRNSICASSRPTSAAASARRCRCRPNTSFWFGWRESCAAPSPGARTGAKT